MWVQMLLEGVSVLGQVSHWLSRPLHCHSSCLPWLLSGILLGFLLVIGFCFFIAFHWAPLSALDLACHSSFLLLPAAENDMLSCTAAEGKDRLDFNIPYLSPIFWHCQIGDLPGLCQSPG